MCVQGSENFQKISKFINQCFLRFFKNFKISSQGFKVFEFEISKSSGEKSQNHGRGAIWSGGLTEGGLGF